MSTLGVTTSPIGEDSTGAYAVAVPITMPENGTLTAISGWSRNGTGANNIVLAVYDDDGGKPGVQLVNTGNLAETVGGSQGLSSGSATLSLVSGTPLWIVIANVAGGPNTTGHLVGQSATGTFYYHQGDGLPSSDSWNTGDFGTAAGAACLYITYTPSGGGGDIPVHEPLAHTPQYQAWIAQ